MHKSKHAGLLARMDQELGNIRKQSQLRTLETLEGINLCSNDYLGLASDATFKQAVIDAVSQAASVGASGSRLLSGNRAEWERLESEFARFAGTEAALYFGSGYAANVGLLSSILRPGDTIFSDALNHASLIDGMRLSGARKIIYPHRDLQALEGSLSETGGASGVRVIVSESVFSMEGDVAPIDALLRLAQEYEAELVLDEAHATGVGGPQGRGMAVGYGCEREVLSIVHTCGKALASAGAFVCGGATLKNFLVNRARTFIFSTAMPPYLAGQIQAALDCARRADGKRLHLRTIAEALRQGLEARGILFGSSTTQIVPVFVGSNEMALHAAAHLQANGFAAKAIRPPTVPAGTARIRVSLTCRITMEDIHRLVDILGEAFESAPQLTTGSSVHA
jgi:8-amino-7-oxononanoate synthase